MKKYPIPLIITLYLALLSCTKEKTDYRTEIDMEIEEYVEFEQAVSIISDGYEISIEALNGILYNGYNEIRLKIKEADTGEDIVPTAFTFLPIATDESGVHSSCPHQYQLEYHADGKYFPGYAVFVTPSSREKTWEVYLSFDVNNQTHRIQKDITVRKQTNMNLNMTSFTTEKEEEYIIALAAPQKPKVGKNYLTAGIYKKDQPEKLIESSFPDPSRFSFSVVDDYTLLIDPRMPEPSMGNHSSPNNKDLTQEPDGLYHGIVNYTMTGDWTLNFILLDENKEVVYGTEVPTDFTPGVEGVKGELHINISF